MTDVTTPPPLPGRMLGRQTPDPARLRKCLWLHDYLAPATPAPPSTNWSKDAGAAIKEALGNDQTGDCVIAEMMHLVGVLAAAKTGKPVVGTTQEAFRQYKSICGWMGIGLGPGCDIASVLDHACNAGIIVGGNAHRFDSYLAFDWTNADMWKFGIFLGGGVPIGVKLPNDWYQSQDGGTWGLTNSGIVGGHGIPAIDYNATGPVISTWGGTRQMTWQAATSKRWVDEAYVVLAPDWYGDDRLAPNGLNVEALKADLELVSRGEAPTIEPSPPDWIDPFGGVF